MPTTRNVEALRFALMAREYVLRMGQRIRERREELGLSQGKVAQEMPPTVDSTAISRWERGLHKPSDDNLEALAKVLKTEVATFLVDAPTGGATPDLLNGGTQLDHIEAAIASLTVELAGLEMRLMNRLDELGRSQSGGSAGRGKKRQTGS